MKCAAPGAFVFLQLCFYNVKRSRGFAEKGKGPVFQKPLSCLRRHCLDIELFGFAEKVFVVLLSNGTSKESILNYFN